LPRQQPRGLALFVSRPGLATSCPFNRLRGWRSVCWPTGIRHSRSFSRCSTCSAPPGGVRPAPTIAARSKLITHPMDTTACRVEHQKLPAATRMHHKFAVIDGKTDHRCSLESGGGHSNDEALLCSLPGFWRPRQPGNDDCRRRAWESTRGCQRKLDRRHRTCRQRTPSVLPHRPVAAT